MKHLNDNPVTRWTVLILIALTMFFGYMFVDVLSPLKTILESARGWDSTTFGIFAGAEYFLNICGFLILAGIILDKMGVRFTGLLSAGLMVAGAGIKLYGVSDIFTSGGWGYDFFNSFWPALPASAKVASLGFMIFGCGCEMAGVTVSKAIAKWFHGKEMALAMGLEMAIARLGVFAVLNMSPWLYDLGTPSVVRPVAITGLLLCIGFLTFTVFNVLDRKLDKQIEQVTGEEEEAFKLSDIGKLFSNRAFLIIAFLCVLYYSAIFPFQKFATDMLMNRLGIGLKQAAFIVSIFPIGAMALTPILGGFLDRVGKGATMLIIGSLLMCGCHLVFALAPLTVPVAYCTIILLGISFSLVPAALWPSMPKLVPARYLGSAYSVTFWIQNIGLWAFPLLIGWSLERSNPGVAAAMQAGNTSAHYDYTVPMLLLASLGIVAFFLGLWLKAEDRKGGYGLEKPNVK